MKAYLRNGPAAGNYVHLEDEDTPEIAVPVLRNTCVHNLDVGNVLAIYRRDPGVYIQMRDIVDFITTFEAKAVGYWCQECEMDRQIKREREEQTDEYLREMRERLHRYVEDIGYDY